MKLICSGIFLLMFIGLHHTCAHGEQMAMLSNSLVSDCAGRLIDAEKTFQRIISLYPAHTENLFYLGAGNAVMGVALSDDFPVEVRNLPRFSPRDGAEKYLAAKPDLVIVRPMIDRGYAPLIKRLEQLGITVVSLQPTDIDEMFLYWKILGCLTGRKIQAEKMIGRFENAVEMIHSLVKNIDQKDRKHVYFEAVHSKMKTFSPDAMPIFAMETAGGINVASGAGSVRGTNIAYFGKERILSMADRIEVYLAQYGTMNRPSIEMIQKEPGFSVIKAVREGNIYMVDEKLVSRPTMRLLSGIFMIGEILYPDIFNQDLKKTMMKQYQQSLAVEWENGNFRTHEQSWGNLK